LIESSRKNDMNDNIIEPAAAVISNKMKKNVAIREAAR
jgi:hypothetical protein